MFNKPIRYSAIFLALMFLIFGLLQYNDPDPFLWMPIYWIAAVISFSVALNRINIVLLWAAMIVYVLGAIYMWPSTYHGIVMDMNTRIEVEEAREALGLLICSIAMGFYLFVFYRRRRRSHI